MFGLVLVLFLILALVVTVPTWPHSKKWGFYPFGGVGLILCVMVVLLLLGRV
jgi:hypothetical protein